MDYFKDYQNEVRVLCIKPSELADLNDLDDRSGDHE